MQTPVIIVGNGISRKDINIRLYKRKGYKLYGCNRAYEDLKFDRLFCTDLGMTKEIVESNYPGRIVVRPGGTELRDERIEIFDADTIHRGPNNRRGIVCTGTRAVLYALEKGYLPYLLGFDLYNPGDNLLERPSQIENMYAGTKFYDVTRKAVRIETAKRFGEQLEKYYDKLWRVTTPSTVSIDPNREISMPEFLSRAAAGYL